MNESDYGEFCITSLKITCWGEPLCLRVTTWRRILWISSFCDWEVNCTQPRTVTEAHAKRVSWCVTLFCNSLPFLLPLLIWSITSNVKTCWCHTKYLSWDYFSPLLCDTSKQIPKQAKVFSPQGQDPNSPFCPLFSGPWMHFTWRPRNMWLSWPSPLQAVLPCLYCEVQQTSPCLYSPGSGSCHWYTSKAFCTAHTLLTCTFSR